MLLVYPDVSWQPFSKRGVVSWDGKEKVVSFLPDVDKNVPSFLSPHAGVERTIQVLFAHLNHLYHKTISTYFTITSFFFSSQY